MSYSKKKMLWFGTLIMIVLATLGLFHGTPSASAASVLVLCDGQTFDGYTSRPFQLKAKTTVNLDPNVQKVIRNCTFRNSAMPAIAIWSAKNVLIEGNTFENIRTHQAGVGVHAISLPCRVPCAIDNVVIRNNTFRWIGADGIQIGEEARFITNVRIEGNRFEGNEDVGENAIDIKGVDGPISVIRNTFEGFRPCLSPKTKPPGTQDCSGDANGAALVIHSSSSGAPHNVTVMDNDFYDNSRGIQVSTGAKNITVAMNRISNSLAVGLLVNKAHSIAITNNTFRDNPIQLLIQYTPQAGGSCTMSGNVFAGTGTSTEIKQSTCK